MKKIFIIIVAILLIQSPSFAENKLSGGVKKTEISQPTETFVEFEDENIKITRERKYLALKDTNTNGYIYSVTNKSNTPIIIKRVSTPDRIDYAIATANISTGSPVSLALSAVSLGVQASILNDAKIYLKQLPQNYTIKPNSNVQVLFLAKKYIDPIVTFEFEINGHLKTINSKSTYVVKNAEYYTKLLKSQYCINSYFSLKYNIIKREIPLIEAYLKSGKLKEDELSKASLLSLVINSEVYQKSLGKATYYEISPFVTEENTKIIELLLKSGANPNAKNVKSLMFQAMKTKDAKIINLLLAYGADANKKYMGMCPAYQAIAYNQPEILELLLDAGADPNVSVKGRTLLHWSIRKKHPEMAKLLIDKKANINEFSGEMSPLTYATKKEQKETVIKLISSGATIDEDAIKYAQKSKDEHIKNLILLQSKWEYCWAD